MHHDLEKLTLHRFLVEHKAPGEVMGAFEILVTAHNERMLYKPKPAERKCIPYTTSEIKKIVDLYTSGYTSSQVADLMGRTAASIRQVLHVTSARKYRKHA